MNNTKIGEEKHPVAVYLKIIGGVIVLAVVILGVLFGYLAHEINSVSYVTIDNQSGADAKFKKIMIEDEVVWEGPAVFVSKKHLKEPWLDSRAGSGTFHFRASKKRIEFRLVTLNDTHEEETVSCTLDNRFRPCYFVVFYYRGKLDCRDCRNALFH